MLLLGVAVRFVLEDSQTKVQTELGDFVDIETTVSLLLWIQGYALKGTYLFVAAVLTSQFVCHVVMKIASLHDWIVRPRRQVSYPI